MQEMTKEQYLLACCLFGEKIANMLWNAASLPSTGENGNRTGNEASSSGAGGGGSTGSSSESGSTGSSSGSGSTGSSTGNTSSSDGEGGVVWGTKEKSSNDNSNADNKYYNYGFSWFGETGDGQSSIDNFSNPDIHGSNSGRRSYNQYAEIGQFSTINYNSLEITYPTDKVLKEYKSWEKAPTVINESNDYVLLLSEDSDEIKYLGPHDKSYEKVDGIITYKSTDKVYKIYDGGKIFIDKDGKVGRTYNAAKPHVKYLWPVISIFGRPEGWHYPTKKNGLVGKWENLLKKNRLFRGD